MQRLRRVLQPLLLMLALLPELWPQSSPAQQPSPYTEQEKAWIAEHPIIHIAVDPNLRPLEYIENGAYKGLTADYLNAIAQASGLRFVVVPVPQNQLVEALKAGQIDVLPAISPRFTSPRIRDQLIVSAPYFVGGTLIVTRAYGETIFEARNLSGKTVAFKSDGIYEQIFRDQYPDIRTLVVATPDEALAAVAADEADAAIGVDSVLLPILYGKYRNRLHVAGTIADVPAILSMGTTTRLPELAEIIRKSLASLTARQTDAMVERWMTRDIYGAPTWAQILRYRWFEATLVAGTLLLLLLAAFHARHARRAAEKSEQDKARFLAVMSHEIRTPMNAILSSIELLGRSKLTQQQRQLSDLATTASEALLELLDDVLDLSKLEARRLTLTKVPTDMRQLARGVIDIAESSARKKNLDIVLQCDLPPATDLLLDPARVRQILINLTSNAVKFTERGLVQVLISLEGGAESGRAELPEQQALSATLLLVVSDTGIGVPPERQKDLFRPYRQAHQTSTRRFGGTGLGLTICRELCELMGGSIQFSSAADVGTRVTCRIPVELTPAQYGPMEEDEGQEIPVPPNNPHAPADSHAKEDGGASGAEEMPAMRRPAPANLTRRRTFRTSWQSKIIPATGWSCASN
ncbi:MAG: sensor protein evgS [Herbaspirillum sp.]|nr:sensor protein evgS [Herbaspirillum sp.]